MKRWTIRKQILWPFLGVTGACVIGITVLNTWLVGRMAREGVERQLAGISRTIQVSHFPLTSRVLEQMSGLSGVEFIVTSEHGEVLQSTLGTGITGFRSVDFATIGYRDPGALHSMAVGNRQFLSLALSLTQRDPSAGPSILHILYPRERLRALALRAMALPMTIGLLALAIAIAIGRHVANRISLTVERLRHRVNVIAQGQPQSSEKPVPDHAERGDRSDDFSGNAWKIQSWKEEDDELRDLDRDISTLVARLDDYELQTRRTEQLRTLARISAGLAHEFRNAVTGCRMAVDLHAQECSEGLSSESLAVAQRQLELMESQLQRFLRSSGQAEEVPAEACEAGRIVTNVADLVRPAARHAGVHFMTESADGIHVWVVGKAIEQVLLNLLLNAMDAAVAASGAGHVPAVELQALADMNRVWFHVWDNGTGPTSSVASSMFEPFVTSKKDGIGLGLSGARDVVNRHQGSLTWARIDERTRFTIELPRYREEGA